MRRCVTLSGPEDPAILRATSSDRVGRVDAQQSQTQHDQVQQDQTQQDQTQQNQAGAGGTALGSLVEEWLDWSEAAGRLGVSVSKVRQLIREHQLAAAVPAEGAGQRVPAALVMDGAIVKGVPGVLTVLHDAGYDDRQALTWLFTADDSLPGRPIDALRENRGSEVKRRAQAMGF
jgi:excisionase family DNA binding protein